VVFCRRATGSPTAASPKPTMILPPLGGFRRPASGRSMDDWWPSRQLVLTTSKISMHSSACVSLLFNVYHKVLLLIPFPVSVLPETVRRFGDLEATKTPECGRLPWVRLLFSSFHPRIPLDVQWEPLRLHAQSPRC